LGFVTALIRPQAQDKGRLHHSRPIADAQTVSIKLQKARGHLRFRFRCLLQDISVRFMGIIFPLGQGKNLVYCLDRS